MAMGSVVFRTIEAVFYTAGVVSLLSIATLANQIAGTPAADRLPTQAIADSLQVFHDHSSLVAVVAFCVGSFLYSVVFFQTRLMPRWLSSLGVVGAISLATACALSLINDQPITGYIPLSAPTAIQEMVLAIWLLAIGFGTSAFPSAPIPSTVASKN
jgi:hypothetical protein